MQNLAVALTLISIAYFLLALLSPRTAVRWSRAPTRFKAILLPIAIFIGATALGVATRPTPGAPTLSTTAAAQPAAILPEEERNLIATITDARTKYAAAEGELQKSSVKVAMLRAVQVAVPHGRATAWTGTIADLGTNGDGDAWVDVTIAPGITVETMNNSFSDAEYHTLIKNGSPIYQRLAQMKKGARVKFTAELLRFLNLTEAGTVNDSEIVARFADVTAAD